jgi:LPXTG-site transpeptidase (sortase) family protein
MHFVNSIALTLTVIQTLAAVVAGLAFSPLAPPAPAAPVSESEPVWRVEIANRGINAPVEAAERTTVDGKRTWTVPCSKAASLMRRGTNTTLFGHRDTCGGVFDNLAFVETGDVVTFDDRTYIVKERHVVVPEEIWPINDHGDARLTMISCWPPGSTAQRLVIVAVHEGPSTRPAPTRVIETITTAPVERTVPTQTPPGASVFGKAASMPMAIVSAGIRLPNMPSR